MTKWSINQFSEGSQWVRADFHLHTKADKEFIFSGKENEFVSQYIEALKNSDIRLGVITNHNKFDISEYKAIRAKGRGEGIGILPGVELSVNDGANGVHALIVFSDEWISEGNDYINSFLSVTFQGKVPDEYEQENGRSTHDLINTLKTLENYNKDFFIVFAHVEANSGLWKELDGGRLSELSKHPLIKKYCMGFQKVRTHDKTDAKCRVKVQGWWDGDYPAELEGCDGKKIEELGRGRESFLKIGEYSFEAVKYALTDHQYRVADRVPKIEHSYINSIRFEGGIFDGEKIKFSPHLNCLIGIRGSGKSSILEALRYVLEIPFGDKTQDKDYKEKLVPFVLKNGGKAIVEAIDKHGNNYEIHRILNHKPDVYIDGDLHTGIAIRETVISKPLYFGQKDLSAAGSGFGHDLVEKLVGDQLKPLRQKISDLSETLDGYVVAMQSLDSDAEQKEEDEEEIKDVTFRLKQFEKYGVQQSLDKQVEFDNDIVRCESLNDIAEKWFQSNGVVIDEADESFKDIESYKSKHNEEIFKKFDTKFGELKETVKKTKENFKKISAINVELKGLKSELDVSKNLLKDDFAEVERKLLKSLQDQGVTSIAPEEYIRLSSRKAALEKSIVDLNKKTSKYSERKDNVIKAVSLLNKTWHSEFLLVNTELEKINKAQKALKVESVYKGDKGHFSKKMEEVFGGNSIRKESFKSILEKYADFGEIYKDSETASKLAKSKADIFINILNDNLNELLSYQVPNSYKVKYHGKDLKSHSLGQRASAMMLFILSQRGNDLVLIDQPEDDLDGQSIYDEVVKVLRDIKSEQQFIFATHNANFPVLGDAENISACAFVDGDISIESGSIDSKGSQKRIIKIMEGGVEAFERRKSIYGMWQ